MYLALVRLESASKEKTDGPDATQTDEESSLRQIDETAPKPPSEQTFRMENLPSSSREYSPNPYHKKREKVLVERVLMTNIRMLTCDNTIEKKLKYDKSQISKLLMNYL